MYVLCKRVGMTSPNQLCSYSVETDGQDSRVMLAHFQILGVYNKLEKIFLKHFETLATSLACKSPARRLTWSFLWSFCLLAQLCPDELFV